MHKQHFDRRRETETTPKANESTKEEEEEEKVIIIKTRAAALLANSEMIMHASCMGERRKESSEVITVATRQSRYSSQRWPKQCLPRPTLLMITQQHKQHNNRHATKSIHANSGINAQAQHQQNWYKKNRTQHTSVTLGDSLSDMRSVCCFGVETEIPDR